jgi:Na+/H+ antiporter NhaD/arsenite permease-like protein
MVMTAILGREGLFAAASRALVRRCDSARALLLRVCGICALLAAAVTNDTVCVFVTPVVTRLCHQLRVVLAPTRMNDSFILYACNWWCMLQQSFVCVFLTPLRQSRAQI